MLTDCHSFEMRNANIMLVHCCVIHLPWHNNWILLLIVAYCLTQTIVTPPLKPPSNSENFAQSVRWYIIYHLHHPTRDDAVGNWLWGELSILNLNITALRLEFILHKHQHTHPFESGVVRITAPGTLRFTPRLSVYRLIQRFHTSSILPISAE